MTVRVIRGCEGVGDIPGVRGGFRGSVGSAQCRLDCHKNSDLRSEVGIGTSLNSTTHCLIESVALLTKLMGIVTPLVLSIVVVVAPRLISYRHKPQDCIIHEFQLDPYCTGLQGWERRERKEAVQCSCVICEVQPKRNVTPAGV